jgi:hypothetical protein
MQRTRIKPTNPKRRREAFARNFGERGEAVRAKPCLALDKIGAWRWGPGELGEDWTLCRGPMQVAHVLARGMGATKGDRRQLVPLCAGHHDEAGEGSWKDEQPSKRAAFQARYGLDLKAEAERIALELDERGLA